MSVSGSEAGDSWIVETRALSKHFGAVRAVDSLNLSIPRSGMTSIVGPNGSGKSTLINILSGTLPFEEGMVVIDGESCHVIRPFDNLSHGLARTFQEVRLFDQMTVWDNIMVVLTARGVVASLFERGAPRAAERARAMIASVGLEEKHESLAMDLSYGQRKLLEIARALAMDVKIFLFDEPFAGLFPQMLEQVKELLQELRRQGRSIIFVSHNMDIVRELSDRIVVMDSGTLLAEGDVDEVLAMPEVVEAYLGT